MSGIQRREFLLLGGVAAASWPLAARAQQAAMPVIGFLRNTAPDEVPHLVAAFHKGLAETGYVEGRNVVIDYRWTHGRADRLPAMAADLVARGVDVIVALGSTPAVRAVTTSTTTIPIVFMIGADPVEIGLVASLNRPGGNLTGVFNLVQQVAQKHLEILHQLAPAATAFALLANPANPATTAFYTRELEAAARTLGLRAALVVYAGGERDFGAAFARLRDLRADALVVAADLLFTSHVEQLAALTLRHAVPAIYPYREFAAAGGLVSYGTDLADTYRIGGIYAGRILKGEKPADLPVQQATKVELIVNLNTAKALGVEVPPTLLARADEVIE